MNHLFLPYELSHKLKHKGFNQPCIAYYIFHSEGENEPTFYLNRPKLEGEFEMFFKHNSDPKTKFWKNPDAKCSAPMYQQAVDWFNTKKIHIEIYCNHSGWGYIITKTNGTTIKDIEDSIFFDNQYQAFDKGIQEALKFIK